MDGSAVKTTAKGPKIVNFIGPEECTDMDGHTHTWAASRACMHLKQAD